MKENISIKKFDITIECTLEQALPILQNFPLIKKLNITKLSSEEEKYVYKKLPNICNLNGFKSQP